MTRRMVIGAALITMLSGAARAEHVTIPTPPDWALTTLDAPPIDGHPVAGARHRAMLPGPGGRPLAAIELVELPQGRDRTGDLGTLMQQALTEASSEFAANQLAERCEPVRPVTVAGRAALRADCTVRRGEQPVLRQAIVMFVTPAGLYSLSYSAGLAGYDAHEPAFERSLAGAALE